MMARILKDFKCAEHGFFEGFYPVCPVGQCVDNIWRVYLKPPAIKSDRTKRADQALNNLASDFKMTDIKSTREGDSQAGYYTRDNEPVPKEARPGDNAIWGGGMNGLTMGSIMSGQAVRPVRDESVGVRPSDVGNLTGPKTASYIPDHENLSIKK
jgi:hypothetical protein